MQFWLAAAQEGITLLLLENEEPTRADLIGCFVETQLCYSNNAPTVGTAGIDFTTVRTHKQLGN